MKKNKKFIKWMKNFDVHFDKKTNHFYIDVECCNCNDKTKNYFIEEELIGYKIAYLAEYEDISHAPFLLIVNNDRQELLSDLDTRISNLEKKK